MSSPSANTRTKTTIIPPDKGAFPLDHFKECEGLVEKYIKCLEKHELMPKRCQKIQMEYIYCRMKSGLMEQETMENLGFTKENTFETEQEKKKKLFEMFSKLNESSRQNVEQYFKNNMETIDNNMDTNK